jgi:hypothetical protein
VSASGTGLAEAQQLYELLQLIDGKLDEVSAKARRTDLNVSRAITALSTALLLVRRLSGDEDVDAAVTKLLRLIQTLNMLRTMMIAVNAASGPWGLLFAGIGAVGTIFTVGDMVGSL